MNQQTPAKAPVIIYILAFPYSGSTLISLAMGKAKMLLNLGEVYFLENDYWVHKQCLCGEKLMDCSFWQGIQRRLIDSQSHLTSRNEYFDLNNSGHSHLIDSRNKGIIVQLKRAIGMVPQKIYKSSLIQEYVKKNDLFFSEVAKETNKMFLVDASKSADRLNVLSEGVSNIRVVWLKRNLKSLFASKLKRVKKRSRFYFPLLSIYYVFWVLHHYYTCKIAYDKLPKSHRLTIYYEDFVENPHGIERKLSDWLGLDINFSLALDNSFNIADQHLYVGNQWVFKNQTKDIRIRKIEPDKGLGKIENKIFSICSKLAPVLNS